METPHGMGESDFPPLHWT